MSPKRNDEEIAVDVPGGSLRGHPVAVQAYLDSVALAKERNRRWPQKENGEVDTRRAMPALVRSFPSLRGADGAEPWELERFVRWLSGPAPSGGAMRAGRFVLHVWNSHDDFREYGRELGIEGFECLTPFNLSDAMGVWDEEHRKAFAAWVEAPFWP
jgi:hypothetical protein